MKLSSQHLEFAGRRAPIGRKGYLMAAGPAHSSVGNMYGEIVAGSIEGLFDA